MSTTFKIGDMVRLTGEAWREEMPEMHGKIVEIVGIAADTDNDANFKYDGRTWWIYNRGDDFSATLVEPAPPPDTRKRLREYTDLCDGDVVVIAGFPMTVANNGNIVRGNQCDYKVNGYSPVADMLVDEVRRKPRTKKRRVYEEVDVKDARAGDVLVYADNTFTRYDGHGNVMSCDTVYRLVEETEVPR